jgi:outer membrane protein assembly factor BamE
MRLPLSSLLRPGLALAACAVAAGCGSVDAVSYRVTDSITPYRVEVVQGNFVSKEQVDQLKPGMTRLQVKELLGTPLVSDIFHAQRWDYIFTLRRQGVPDQARRLTVYFNGDALERSDGDVMPSESEFIASINKRKGGGKVPQLEASEDQLQRAGSKPAATASRTAPPEPPPVVSYPPLEPVSR